MPRRLDPQQRRDAILAAAVAAFGERAYDDVSLAEVGAAADASEALVYRYFEGKGELYAQVVALSLADLDSRTHAALAALTPQQSARDRVRTTVLARMDHVAAQPALSSAPLRNDRREPPQAAALRVAARECELSWLAELLHTATWRRRELALTGYQGFVDALLLGWVDRGCPDDERHLLVDTALGALEGALGDWAG